MKQLAKKPKDLNILGVVYPDLAPGVHVTHAGLEETAILWRIGQLNSVNLVDMKYFSPRPETLPLYSMPDESAVSIHEDPLWNWKQIFPHPEQCNPELGEKLLTTFSTGILEEIKACLEEMTF